MAVGDVRNGGGGSIPQQLSSQMVTLLGNESWRFGSAEVAKQYYDVDGVFWEWSLR